MSSEEIVSHNLSDEQLQELEQLAALNWSKREIALYFGMHLTRFNNLFDKGDLEPGTLRYHFERGILARRAAVDKSLSDSAENGNLTAIQIYKKECLNNHLRQFKEDLLNGSV